MTFNETQEQFARRMGLSAVTVARYETNSRPRKAILVQLAAIARERHLDEYAHIFEGDETRVSSLQKNEFYASIDYLHKVIETLLPNKTRSVRAAAALLEADDADLDKIEDLLGGEIVRADEMIQMFTSHYDREAAEERVARGTPLHQRERTGRADKPKRRHRK